MKISMKNKIYITIHCYLVFKSILVLFPNFYNVFDTSWSHCTQWFHTPSNKSRGYYFNSRWVSTLVHYKYKFEIFLRPIGKLNQANTDYTLGLAHFQCCNMHYMYLPRALEWDLKDSRNRFYHTINMYMYITNSLDINAINLQYWHSGLMAHH